MREKLLLLFGSHRTWWGGSYYSNCCNNNNMWGGLLLFLDSKTTVLMYSSSLLPYQRETRNKKKRNYACGKSGNNWFATFQACLNIVIQEERKRYKPIWIRGMLSTEKKSPQYVETMRGKTKGSSDHILIPWKNLSSFFHRPNYANEDLFFYDFQLSRRYERLIQVSKQTINS